MTVYFQHVGEKGGKRDFPRTIGTPEGGLIRFIWSDIADYVGHLSASERRTLENQATTATPQGFQIWGIPAGAKSVLRELSVGDYLLLLESATPGGQFAYAGRVIAAPSLECHDLSVHLWGEHKFPLIVLLNGGLTTFSFAAFCEALGYSTNWNPAGQTYRIQSSRFAGSPFTTEDKLISAMIGFTPSSNMPSETQDETFTDPAELDIADEEGRKQLHIHLKRERSTRLVTEFKRRLKNPACCVCGFDFGKAYGERGRGFIEAHHVVPVSEMQEGDKTRLEDLVPVCSNCHRIIHRQVPLLAWEDLKQIVADQFIKAQDGEELGASGSLRRANRI